MIGDTHFGNDRIVRFRTQFQTEEEHSSFICKKWNETIKDRDIVYVLGDVADSHSGLRRFASLRGRKILVRGNHDVFSTDEYLKYFEEVHGALLYKGYWLTHIPIHPEELYGRSNIHGHTHRGGPREVHYSSREGRNRVPRTPATYFCTCAEHIEFTPIRFDRIKETLNERIKDGVA